MEVNKRSRAQWMRGCSPQSSCVLVVVERIVMHAKQLIGLAEPIPSSVVLPIDVHRASVRLDRRMRVLHLNIFMAHQCPGGKVGPIQFCRSPEVLDGFLVFLPQRVVVTD